MKSALILLAAFLCLIAAKGHQNSHHRQQFDAYLKQFQKSYESEEHETRFQNFVATLRRLKKHNPNAPYKVGLNRFSDWSVEEFRRSMLGPKVSSKALANSCLANGVTAVHTAVKDLPASFDWRDKKVVTPVKDQGQCGSCWAFSTIANIESQWAIKGHPLTNFSEQLLVDCSQGCSNEPPYGTVCNQGCNGGWQWNAFFDIVSWGGVETEVAYPYTAADGTCAMNKQLLQAPIKGYQCLTNPNATGANEDTMASFMMQNGPLSIAMDATPLQDYSSGVIDPWFGEWDCDGTQLDHALLIVGWGVEHSDLWGDIPFWIIKNSWASSWGEDGYFRILRGAGACGLNNAVSIALM